MLNCAVSCILCAFYNEAITERNAYKNKNMNLMELLKWQMSDGVLDGLSSQLNIGDKKETSNAANAAISILMSALTKNATNSNDGLSGLVGALDRDHDGSILDDIMGLMTGKSQSNNQSMMNGAGILKHLLGAKQNNAIDMLTKVSGLDQNQSSGLLMKLAPMVLGVLGRVKKQKSMDQVGLQDYLRKSQDQFVQEDSQRSIFTKLLDQDGDGNAMDEIASIGMKVLGGFLRR